VAKTRQVLTFEVMFDSEEGGDNHDSVVEELALLAKDTSEHVLRYTKKLDSKIHFMITLRDSEVHPIQ